MKTLFLASVFGAATMGAVSVPLLGDPFTFGKKKPHSITATPLNVTPGGTVTLGTMPHAFVLTDVTYGCWGAGPDCMVLSANGQPALVVPTLTHRPSTSSGICGSLHLNSGVLFAVGSTITLSLNPGNAAGATNLSVTLTGYIPS